MSGSSASHATTRQSSQGWIRRADARRDRPFCAAPSVSDQRVFESKLLFLELMKKHIVGVGPMLFGMVGATHLSAMSLPVLLVTSVIGLGFWFGMIKRSFKVKTTV